MLRLRNVVKSYTNGRNKTVVLNDVNLDFKKNELVFILGTSGSGKSTLLNSIALNIDIDKGDIIYKDKVVNKLKRNNKDSYRNQVIGMIYQDYNLIDYMNVIDNVMLPSNRKISKNKVDNLLKELNIYDKKHVLVKMVLLVKIKEAILVLLDLLVMDLLSKVNLLQLNLLLNSLKR